ncbi:MAG: DNA polymerase III, subunit gamma and tau [Bdellovibrionales bacterium RIFOXYD1_FULL_53_11]|nr:MAG: DNA polymerase III, subunit gamma and tau [Bdellovibrionales bacterium RIFOXYD1_FULL_53_11]
MNAIRDNRDGGAYLLTGPRGIGKTSIARIFSKTLRCKSVSWDGTWLKSCDKCPDCTEITAGTSVDVIEIDGASNNGVDAVREIRENAKFLPSSGGRKIYIIDEVHMLTTAAFNALLKTVEEPPPHVTFIFATTEPHKIPDTILSRCQRFDLRRVTVAEIHTRLTEVAKAEGVKSEPAAFTLLAHAAEGSMRDALSLMDQVIAFSSGNITAQAVRESIGLVETQALHGIIRGIFGRKPADALYIVNQAYMHGHDLRVMMRGIIESLHSVILAKVGVPDNDLPEDERESITALASMREIEEIELIFQVMHQGLDWIARSPRPKAVFDVLVVKCATAEALVSSTPAQQSSPPPSAPRAAPPASAQSTSSQAKTWDGLISFVRDKRPMLASILEHGACNDISRACAAGTLEISFKSSDSYFRTQILARACNEQLSQLCKEFFGRGIAIRAELNDTAETPADKRERERQRHERAAIDAAQNHPVITEAKSLFGGELGPVEITKKGDSDAPG